MVICKIPRAGLGNQLFPLIKAYVFAELNNEKKIIVTGYHQLKPGPYIRREKSKRRYNGYFIFQKNIAGEFLDRFRIKNIKNDVVIEEPPLKSLQCSENPANKVAVYSTIPGWQDFFAGLREHRTLVKEIFWKLIRTSIKKEVFLLNVPRIGVHVRMGDFRKSVNSQDFKKGGHVRTPEFYFIDVITKIREMHGTALPVTVFTDGYKNEFEKLFSIGNISLAEGNPDIVDLLLLSRSSIIVASAGSTFSYWAGFLSDAPIILHPDHIHARIRSAEEKDLYEGPMNSDNIVLIAAIKKIAAGS